MYLIKYSILLKLTRIRKLKSVMVYGDISDTKAWMKISIMKILNHSYMQIIFKNIYSMKQYYLQLFVCVRAYHCLLPEQYHGEKAIAPVSSPWFTITN